MEVLLVCCGDATPTIINSPDIGVFECVDTLYLRNEQEFLAQKELFAQKVLEFADAPPLGGLFYFRNYLSLVSNLGVPQNTPRRQPKVVLFTEDIWKDAPDADGTWIAAEKVLKSGQWRKFALNNGVVACLYTFNERSLGDRGYHARAKRLVELGFDYVIDARAIEGSASRKHEAELLAKSIARRYALLHRQKNWAFHSIGTGAALAIVVFIAFGMAQSIAAEVVGFFWELAVGR